MEPREWALVGCLGTEGRWSTAGRILSDAGQLADYLLFEIHDAPSIDEARPYGERAPLRYEELQERMLTVSRKRFIACGGSEDGVSRQWLLETDDVFVDRVAQFLKSAGRSIVLDISCMPKRYFFPILRTLLEDAGIEDLAVAYTAPASYGSVLSVDPDECVSLPRFDNQSAHDRDRVVVVAAGFEPHGVVELLKRDPGETVAVHVMLPFPASSSSVRKSWEFIRSIEAHLPAEAKEPIRVDPLDVPGAFEMLKAVTRDGTVHATLGPYGPKTLSLAMCIFATQSDRTGVLYSQPMSYNPRYSSGVAIDSATGLKKCHLYPLRLSGRDLYSLSSDA